jgi:O-antigen/teichoic acid export membrane protein
VTHRNLAANYLNVGWVALMGFAFIPLYVKYLGVEAYGLIGLFAVLQVWLNLLDVGLSPTLSREMARFSGGSQDATSIRRLLRTVELIAFAFSAVIVALLLLSAQWLSVNWVQPSRLPAETVTHALMWMGLIGGIGFLEGIYRSAVIGLQRQVALSAITSSVATLKGLGAVALIAFVSPNIELFFAWQAGCSLLVLMSLRYLVYSTLPKATGPVRFDWAALIQIRTFAAGVFTTTLLATLLTQSDKFILTAMLSLESWGHYSLAVVSAGALALLYQPIYQAWLPRMSELVAAAKHEELLRMFHLGSQLVAVVIGSAAAVAIFNADELLFAWTGDRQLVNEFAPIFCLLVAGNMLNGLLAIPYAVQLAHGWTSLGVKANAAAVLILVPSLLIVVPKYGGMGAAMLWVLLNLGYLFIGMHFMFLRLMKEHKLRWYLTDIALPLSASAVTAGILSAAVPEAGSRLVTGMVPIIIGALVLCLTAAVSPDVRSHARLMLQK